MRALAVISCLASLCALAEAAEKCDFHTRLVEHLMEKRYQDEPNDIENGGGRGNMWMQNSTRTQFACWNATHALLPAGPLALRRRTRVRSHALALHLARSLLCPLPDWEPTIRCVENRRVGHFGEGGKWICDPDCLLLPHHCTIFSIGSNNEFSFEESLQTHECEIFTFDHTTGGEAHPSFVHFNRYGIAANSGGNMKTLVDMAALANVSDIDVFKIDCEGCEFEVFSDPATLDFIQHHVKQILLEGACSLFSVLVHPTHAACSAVHFKTEEQTKQLAHNLQSHGFRGASSQQCACPPPHTSALSPPSVQQRAQHCLLGRIVCRVFDAQVRIFLLREPLPKLTPSRTQCEIAAEEMMLVLTVRTVKTTPRARTPI